MLKLNATKLLLPPFQPCFRDKHLYTFFPAGRSSGKSVDVSTLLILDTILDGRINSLVFRLYHKDHLDSTYQELKKTIYRIFGEETDTYWKFNESPSKLQITYLPFGNIIGFRGLTETTSIKGTTIGKGWYCRFWLEEAQQIANEQDFLDVDKSFRGQLGEGMYPKWYISFNSPYEGHWLQKRIENCSVKVNFPKNKYITEGYENYTYKSISDKKGTDELSMAVYSVYTENPYLTKLDIQKFELDKFSNRQHFEQEMLGEFLAKGETIYTNWEIGTMNLEDLTKVEFGEKREWRAINGLDWGWVDPTALACCMVNKKRKVVYIYDEHYETELTGEQVAGRIISKGYGNILTVADSARADLIHTLKRNGIRRIKGVKKCKGNGMDNIEYGISLVQKYKIIVNPKCVSTIRELRNYAWKKDNMGNRTNVPIDEWNHIMDCCFDENTLVLTNEGYKKIKFIKENDEVLSYNENTKKYEYKKVLSAGLTKKSVETIKLTICGKEIICTPEHRFLTPFGWKEAKDLKGYHILSINGLCECEKIEKACYRDVYNLEVEDNHNYIVEGMVAHNCRYIITMVEKFGQEFMNVPW